MKKNFTKLLCVVIASFSMVSAMGQEKVPLIRMGETIVPIERNDIRLRAGEVQWPDSVVMYDDRGDILYVFYTPTKGPEVYYSDGYWFMTATHFTVYIWPRDFDVIYNSGGLVESLTYLEDKMGYYFRYQFQYNANGYILSSETHRRPVGGTNWELLFRTTHFYDTYDNWLGYKEYNLGGAVPELNFAYTARVDGQGRIVFCEDSASGWYIVDGSERYNQFSYYIWYYSDGRIPNIDPENNTPIGESNQGGFDLDINIPVDSIDNGSLVVNLPEGFILDATNTSLTLDFAGKFELKITKQDNNSWLFEIKLKSTRSVLLRAD